MQEKRTNWSTGLLAIAVVAVMALGALQVGVLTSRSSAPATVASGMSLPVTATHPAAAEASSHAPAAAVSPAIGPHPGTLAVYDVYPGGATTEDPAVAYDTVSYEPILNVFETLLTYNGSSSTTYVPILATCVPGTTQCTTDYDSSLIANNGKGQPTYYTFVIDPAAKFYDPATTTSWGVYPTDVMFSIAREMAYAEAIGVGNTPGWLVAQALLPNGSGTWDGGVHAPYNTTPADILGSMLVNDTNYCPAAAMTSAHGCITFNVSGQGGPWPFFLQLIGDGFMGILPCGWYSNSAQGAGLPGWAAPAHADNSCLLPNGGTTTQTAGWTTYLAGLDPTSWDTFEANLGATYPAPAPNVQWNMVGSGPYYSVVTPTSSPPGYSLLTNPGYAQPVGCSGAGGLATYGGYCWPAPGHYIGNVSVNYESTDATGINEYKAGQADFAGILTTDTGELLTLASQGKLDYYNAHGLSVFFQMPNLNYSPSVYVTDGLPAGVNIPNDFFSGSAARALMTTIVPYTTMESEANTVDGVQYYFLGGGPIVQGMNGYATNISYPYKAGNPGTDPSVVGSAAWWWKVGTTVGSGYYDPELASCLNTTCIFPVIGENGASNLDIDITLEINSIEAITSHHIVPYTYDLNFGGPCPSLICYQLGGEGPGAAALPYWNLGWAADNFAPEDYLIPMAFPNSTYTYGDAVYQQFNLKEYNDPALCGHATATQANLTYWAKQPALNSSCEGVAYDVANAFFYTSTHDTNLAEQTYIYWGIQAILNNLNLYVWNGQANEVVSSAPWIDGNSINFNPTVGGGNDQFWFQIRYGSLYNVTVTESGLPAGTKWTATDGPQTVSSVKTSITFAGQLNGTYNFSASYEGGYSASPANGTVTITGGAVSQTVTYTAFSATTAAVTFSESGILSNTSWSVVVAGYGSASSNSPNIVFDLPQSVNYNYQPGNVLGYQTAAGGVVDVGTSAVTVNLAYVGVTTSGYPLQFTETGLAKNTLWSITLGPPKSAFTLSSNTTSLVFYEKNGSFNYSVGQPVGFAAVVTLGAVNVQGSAVSVLVVMNPTYTVSFSPTGLPTGASWSVYFGGQEQNGTAPGTLSFTVINGSWTFSITSTGHTPSPAGGSVKVAGGDKSVGIAFAPTSTSSSPAWTYLSPLAEILIGALAVGLVVLAAVVARLWRRLPPASPPESWAEGSKPGEEEAFPPTESTPPKT